MAQKIDGGHRNATTNSKKWSENWDALDSKHPVPYGPCKKGL